MIRSLLRILGYLAVFTAGYLTAVALGLIGSKFVDLDRGAA